MNKYNIHVLRTCFHLLSLVLVIFIFFFPSSNKAWACPAGYMNRTIVSGTCGGATCNGSSVNGVWQGIVQYTYPYDPTCTQLEYFGDNQCSIGDEAANPCPAQCDPSQSDSSQCGQGICTSGSNTSGQSLCIDNYRGSGPYWCQGFDCGYYCDRTNPNSPSCQRYYPGQGYSQMSQATCSSLCTAAPTPTFTPTPTPDLTCTQKWGPGNYIGCGVCHGYPPAGGTCIDHGDGCCVGTPPPANPTVTPTLTPTPQGAPFCQYGVQCQNFTVRNNTTGQVVSGKQMPTTPNILTVSTGDNVTISGNAGPTNAGQFILNTSACVTNTWIRYAGFSIYNLSAGGALQNQCFSAIDASEGAGQDFVNYWCQGMTTFAAYNNAAGNFRNVYGAQWMPWKYGQVNLGGSYPAGTSFYGYCDKDGYAHWCSGCPWTGGQANYCNQWCAGNAAASTFTPDCFYSANGLNEQPRYLTRDAKASYTFTQPGITYRITDTAYGQYGAGGTDNNPCAIDVAVQQGPAGPCTDLGGIATSRPSAIVYKGAMYVFVKGSDNAVYYKTSTTDDKDFSGWVDIGGIGYSDPATGVGADGRLYLQIQGTGGGNYYQSTDGTSWSGWNVGNAPYPVATTTQITFNAVTYTFSITGSGSVQVCSSAVITYTIEGYAYYDPNNDDSSGSGIIPNADDSPLGGVVVSIPALSGTVTPVTTDATGYYKLTGIPSNSVYNVQADATPLGLGYVKSSGTANPRPGGDGAGSTGINFAFTKPLTIQGRVFNDKSGDKKYESGEDYTGGISGKITINYASATVTTNDANGTYSISNLLPGQYLVTYNGPPAGYSIVWPNTTVPPSFLVTVGPGCNPNDPIDASCSGNSIINLNFAITNSLPWFKAYGGDMRFESNQDFHIPDPTTNPSFCENYALSPQDSTTPLTSTGVIFGGDATLTFPVDESASRTLSSHTQWVAGGSGPTYKEIYATPGALHLSYNTILDLAKTQGITPQPIPCDPSACSLPSNLSDGIYQVNSSLNLTGVQNNTPLTFGRSKNYIFLINGTLTIKTPIIIDPASNTTVTFIAQNNINIDSSIGSVPSCPVPSDTNKVDGTFVAGHDFTLQSSGTCASGSSDKMLNMEGSIIVDANRKGGSFVNNRDLCASDATIPSFTIKKRLDFIINAPEFLKNQNVSFKEVAP